MRHANTLYRKVTVLGYPHTCAVRCSATTLVPLSDQNLRILHTGMASAHIVRCHSIGGVEIVVPAPSDSLCQLSETLLRQPIQLAARIESVTQILTAPNSWIQQYLQGCGSLCDLLINPPGLRSQIIKIKLPDFNP